MVSESVLYNNRIWFIIMLLIVTVMVCSFNAVTSKAEKPGAAPSETPAVNATLPAANSQPLPPEPVRASQGWPGFYRHPAGIFSFNLPGEWRLVSETDSMAVFTRGRSELGALLTHTGPAADAKLLPDFRDTFLAGFLNFADEYTIVRQEVQPDQSTSLTVRYHSAGEGNGQVDFLFVQHEAVMFVLYLRTPAPAADAAAWAKVTASYTLEAAPSLE